ncbi:MAG: glycosyltransferase [Planctomycetota bacterium]
MDGTTIQRVTALVTAGDEPKALPRLLKSLRKFCPDLAVLVAGPQPARLPRGVTFVPHDGGVSGARNTLLARLRTPVFVLLDDRMQLHPESNLEEMVRPVVDGELDIASGEITACRKRWLWTRRRPAPSHGTFELTHRELVLRPGHREATDRYHMCDIVPNFFVARTDKVRLLGGWDELLKRDERAEFFLRAFRQGLRVGYCPAVNAWRWDGAGKDEPADLTDYAALAVERMGLERMVGFDGAVYASNALVRRAA